MTVEEWARGLLFGSTLADKLAPGVDLDDRPHAPIAVPALPGRPPGLALARADSPKSVSSAEDRARVLHAFANHELLAIETFALALLRFPDAPPSFRRGIVGTIADEQRHLGLYRGRIDALGFELGDFPASGYFWRALADAPTPRAFVARMSLGFEQANLDFAAHWAARFRAVDDPLTAGVLDVVLADEIAHVRHGARWFDAWRDGDWWTAWTAELMPPLTPARAKGPGFSREVRLAAGLPADVIDRLELFAGSKGRPPRLFALDPAAEDDVIGVVTPITAEIARDLETLPLWLAGRDDAVLVAAVPDPAFLRTLAAAAVALPAFVTAVPAPNHGIFPWAWTPSTCARFGRTWDDGLRTVWSKAWSVALAAEIDDPDVVGVVCTAWDDVARRLNDRPMVFKAPYATAGRDRRRWNGGETDALRGWVEGCIARQGAVIVEPWLDRVADLSVQITVGDGVRVDGTGRFMTDEGGRYRGAVLGSPATGLPADVARAVHASEGALLEAARLVGARLADHGFAGPAGIDALIYRTPGGELRCKPIVEVNPRVTMGRIALALARRVRTVGAWLHVGRRTGLVGLGERVAAIGTTIEQGRLARGALCTTDPTRARHVGTVLIAASTWAEVAAISARATAKPSPG